MSSLLRYFSVRHQKRHLFRAILGLTSIALGVALFASVEISQASTVHGFEVAARRIAGKAELRVSRGRRTGIDLSVLKTLEGMEGVVATPVLQRSTTCPDLDAGRVLILGVDFLRESRFREYSHQDVTFNPLLMNRRALLVTAAFAKRHRLAIGSTVRVNSPRGIQALHVAGVIENTGAADVFDGNIALMRIDGAQELFATNGRVDRIDVYPADAADAIREALGADIMVDPVQTRSSVMEEVLARIRSLRAISLIATLVGIFIVYLSVSMGVVERTKEVGTMRALGGSRGQVLALFLAEAGVIGFLGALLGLGLGYGLARGLTDFTAQTINLLSHQVHVTELVVPAWIVAAGLAGGTAVALFAALLPALRATGISPMAVLRPTRFGYQLRLNHRRGFLFGAALFAANMVIITRYFREVHPSVLLFGGVAMLLATAFMLPQLTVWVSLLMRRPLRALFRIEGYLAADNVMKYPQRTALTVVALGGALGIMVTSASVFASFEYSGMRWIEKAFPWDLTVQVTDLDKAHFSDARLPAEVADRVRAVDGVASAFGIETVLQAYGDRDVMILAADMDGYIEMMKRAGMDWAEVDVEVDRLREIGRGEAVGVSRNFQQLYGVNPGDTLELRTPSGLKRFKVAGSLEDFTWPQGTIFVDLAHYRRVWDDPAIGMVDVRVAPGHDPAKVKAAIGRALGDEFQVFVYSKAEFSAIAHDALEQGFQLVRVQMLLAMFIGFLGIVNTLLISVLRRTREIGLLRAVGMTRGQVGRTVVIESILVAFVGGIVGVGAGLIGAAFPVGKHTLVTTGFELLFMIPWSTIGLALGASLLLGAIASWLPARRAAGLNLMEAVGYE